MLDLMAPGKYRPMSWQVSTHGTSTFRIHTSLGYHVYEKFFYRDHAWLLTAMVNAVVHMDTSAKHTAGEEFCLRPLGQKRVMLLIGKKRKCIQLNFG